MDISKVICLVLHYGSKNYTINCIESIQNHHPQIKIIVVDNDPFQNLNLDNIKSENIILKHTGGLMGFAAANNFGLKNLNIDYKYIFFLNNDTILESNTIKNLLDVLKRNDIGAVGPCMFYDFNKTKIWACGGWINWTRINIGGHNYKKNNSFYDVDYLPGAAILCKKEVLDKCNGFPEQYFLGFEEAELCQKIKKQNKKVMAVPSAEMIHFVGMSDQKRPDYIYNRIRNRLKLGAFLYGNIGLVIGIINSIDEVIIPSILFKTPKLIIIWFLAIKDELNGILLDKIALENISKRFEY